jgi:hypothetical protein
VAFTNREINIMRRFGFWQRRKRLYAESNCYDKGVWRQALDDMGTFITNNKATINLAFSGTTETPGPKQKLSNLGKATCLAIAVIDWVLTEDSE